MDQIPDDGTVRAVNYWATRTREDLRRVERLIAHGHYDEIAEYATDAAGCAGCFEQAARALAEGAAATPSH